MNEVNAHARFPLYLLIVIATYCFIQITAILTHVIKARVGMISQPRRNGRVTAMLAIPARGVKYHQVRGSAE